MISAASTRTSSLKSSAPSLKNPPMWSISVCRGLGRIANGIKQPKYGRTPRWHHGLPQQIPGMASTPFLPRTNLSSIPTDPSTFAIEGSRYVSSMLTHTLENHGFSGPEAELSPDLAKWIHQSVSSAYPEPEKRIFYLAWRKFSGNFTFQTERLKLNFLSLYP